MDFATIVADRKVGVFLNGHPGLLAALRAAGAREIAVFDREHSAGGSGETPIRYRGHGDVRRNNADVLILDGGATLALRRFRVFGHAKYVLVRAGMSSIQAWLLASLDLVRRRLAFRGTARLPGARWFVFENTNRKFAGGPRFYVSIAGGMRELASNLAGVDYCVLRWHRRLARPEQLSDLDILVSNEHLDELLARFNRRFGFFPADVFTAFSAQGHNIRGMSYFPPLRARELLDHCVEGLHGERRPDARHTLLAFAYHLLFHKGIRKLESGDRLSPDSWQSPDYHEELMLLCDEANVARFATLQDLERYLRDHDWFPPRETLNKIAKHNSLVRERYYDPGECRPGLIVFALREIAVRHALVPAIEDMIRGYGFEIIRSAPIPEDLRARVAAEFRGGNWYSFADREAEGGPAHFIIAIDPKPVALADAWMLPGTRARYRHIDNHRALKKIRIRDRVARRLGNWRLNALHASDNSREALDYVRVVTPDLYESLERRMTRDATPAENRR